MNPQKTWVSNGARSTALLIAACFGVGCATTGTEGAVEIGDGVYMIGGLGSSTDHSGSAVKAKFFKAAMEFCSAKRARMIPLNSTAQDAAGYQYASAEVQFRCKSEVQ